MKKVTIIDYGVGNLFSVSKALGEHDVRVDFATHPEEIIVADRLVLPGVGAFGDCIKEIRERHLSDAIIEYAGSGKPLLGICVGMQVLLSKSFEFGEHEGLDLISGTVEKIPMIKVDGSSHKVPYVGWARIYSNVDSVFMGKIHNMWYYLVHSYMAKPKNPDDISGYYNYNGQKITAMIKRNNIIGCQFHPEKSGANGLELLKEFVND